jgi:SAM-dependent methyltransferase
MTGGDLEKDIVKNYFIRQPSSIYEKAHGARLDHLVENLNLNQITNSKIADIGCGFGPIFNRIADPQKNNTLIGFDGCDQTKDKLTFEYIKTNLDLPFADKFLEERGFEFDYVFCFEACEHIANLYNCLSEIKKILKKDGILYLSIPHADTEHNTLYPGLFYPVNNFRQFLGQMAFNIIDMREHRKSFSQNVFILQNKDWSFSKMLWPKQEEKFKNIPPIVSINL